MFGRKQDEDNGGKDEDQGNDDAVVAKDAEDADSVQATEDDDGSMESFSSGIRVDAPTRRPRQAEANDGKGEAGQVAEDSALPLAVPPSAGGAHRSAVYRTAPDETTATETVAQTSEQGMDGEASKRLTVGNGISLKGEISNCDALVVEGHVEANLTESRSVTVGQTGILKGTVEVEEATISGEFEGTLVVRNVLTITKTGRVRGEVRYGALQVEAGGVLAGTANTMESE